MNRPPLESWKRRPPSDRDEARAADLLRQLGDAETLSPQAQHRVAHRIRAPLRRRHPLFGDVRLAAASVAVLILFVTGTVVTLRFFDRQAEVSAASRVPADRTLALNGAAPPLAAPRREEAPSEALRLEEPELRLDSRGEGRKRFAGEFGGGEPGESGFARPPPGWAQGTPSSPSDALAMKKAAAPASRSRAESKTVDMAAAPPAAPMGMGAGQVAGSANDTATGDVCASRIPDYSAAIARNQGDLEQALFGRGTCFLRSGKREAGEADLRAYLGRFPNGRFAERVRGLLVKSPAQSPTP